MDFREIEFSEELKLEDMVKDNLERLEEGLVFIDNQVSTRRGPLDILALGSDNELVVIELKIQQDDGMLMQALDYYDWVNENVDTVKRMYSARHPNLNIDPKQAVRLLLVAPSYSETLIRRARYLSISVALYTYICIEANGKRGLIFRTQEIPPLTTPPPTKKTRKDFVEYIRKPEGRNFFEETCERIKSIGRDVEEYYTQGSVSWRVKGGYVFASLCPIQNGEYESLYAYVDKQWRWVKVVDEKDLGKALSLVRFSYKDAGGKADIQQSEESEELQTEEPKTS